MILCSNSICICADASLLFQMARLSTLAEIERFEKKLVELDIFADPLWSLDEKVARPRPIALGVNLTKLTKQQADFVKSLARPSKRLASDPSSTCQCTWNDLRFVRARFSFQL